MNKMYQVGDGKITEFEDLPLGCAWLDRKSQLIYFCYSGADNSSEDVLCLQEDPNDADTYEEYTVVRTVSVKELKDTIRKIEGGQTND